jgi:hypothetical protein
MAEHLSEAHLNLIAMLARQALPMSHGSVDPMTALDLLDQKLIGVNKADRCLTPTGDGLSLVRAAH